MIINKQEEEIIIIKVKKMEDGLNQVKTFKTQVLLFIKANILMVRNMVSGIFCIKGMQISHLNQSFGFYDQQNNFIDSIKIGRWIEPDDGFWNLSQVINIGEYKYGKKVGLWDIKYRISDNQSFQIIGGGYYKQLEDNSVLGSFKNGQWIELTDGFWRDKQVTYYGEYLNGYKVGKWDIYYNNQETEQNEYMEIEQIECTIWDSLNYKFKKITILIKFNEEKEVSYIQNGQIIRIEQNRLNIFNGVEITDRTLKKLIDGQEVGIKQPLKMLVDITLLLERKKVYGRSQAKIIKGMMFKSMKLENTSIIREEEHESLYMIINKQEEEIIIIKVKKMEDGLNQVKTFKSEYINGKKYGIWDILYKRNANKSFKLIAFGFYDQQNNFIDSIKIGRWIEPDDGFWNLSQVINIGEYKYGKKVGLWDIKYRISDNQSFQIIGGGYYKQLEDNSVLGSFKNGQWIELTDGFWRDKQVTYYGEYLNGYKVGKWDIYYNNQETEQNEYMQENISFKFFNFVVVIHMLKKLQELIYIQLRLENGQS
ncbi:unnamed protein product [Paramecium sonneborni]|uniref:Uncharacterized protein n=1 Tax=Paramecium sonneborni TaxID=65129 RepID=A0A8S1KWQ0_9CILI|nr:unnamed protein product [Paramecium sonneborni]